VIAVDLPVHLYGYVDRAYLSQHTKRGWEPAIWFGITVPRNRAIGLTVLLECGAQYRELPSHAWAFDTAAPPWTLEAAQAWDCFGGTAQIVRYTYLQDLSARLIRPPKLTGTYLHTLEFADNGFSLEPAQSKSLHALRLANGRLTWQPNDRLLWHDPSFTDADAPVPTWLRRQTSVWGVEGLD
jgi:hypothetical protein